MKDIDVNGFKNLVRYYKGINKIPLKDLLFISDKVWMNMTEEEKTSLLPIVEKYWNEYGFPYQDMSIEDITEEYDKLLEFNPDSVFIPEVKEITQHNLGLATANNFHPHKYSVSAKGYRSPMDNYTNKKLFKRVLLKTMKFSGNPFNKTGMRNMMGIFSGTQGVSNFRPSAARYIYSKYCPVGGKILDPSLGYSGRLLAALTSNASHYEGCDPCIATYEGGKNLLKTIQNIESKRNKLSSFMDDGERKNRLPNVVLHNIPFEEYKGPSDFFDLVWTSPPYFDREIYSNEETQSWKKFGQYDLWVEGFLRPLITTSYRVLKKNGYLILNIYGKVGTRCIEEDTIKIAKEIFGYKPDDIIYLQLSKMMGIKNTGKIKNRNDRYEHKIEPVFVWMKR